MKERYEDLSPLVRLDFSDDTRWREAVAAAGAAYEEEFRASVDPVDDPRFDGSTTDAVIAAFGECAPYLFMFADQRTMLDPEMTFLYIDREYRDCPVRCPADQLWGIENNIRLSNMEIRSFVEATGDDGVFRGFPR
jgi:hypothetical protein